MNALIQRGIRQGRSRRRRVQRRRELYQGWHKKEAEEAELQRRRELPWKIVMMPHGRDFLGVRNLTSCWGSGYIPDCRRADGVMWNWKIIVVKKPKLETHLTCPHLFWLDHPRKKSKTGDPSGISSSSLTSEIQIDGGNTNNVTDEDAVLIKDFGSPMKNFLQGGSTQSHQSDCVIFWGV